VLARKDDSREINILQVEHERQGTWQNLYGYVFAAVFSNLPT
jgi:hypothetical protein